MNPPHSPVRMAITSDLHYDPSGTLTQPDRIIQLVERIRGDHPDLIVIAGDLAHGLERFRECLAFFAGLDTPVAVLVGNHDVWRDAEGGHASADLWHRLLPGAVREAGAVWLEDETLRLGPVAVLGSMVWYDYSALDPGLTLSIEKIAAAKRLLNNDARWIDWDYSDPELAGMLGEALQQRLEAASQDTSIHQIVLVTHVPIFEQQMLRKPHDPQWGLGNAYFGNLTVGQRVMPHEKVKAVVSGHTHIGQQGWIAREPAPPLAYYVVPSDYGRPEYIVLDC